MGGFRHALTVNQIILVQNPKIHMIFFTKKTTQKPVSKWLNRKNEGRRNVWGVWGATFTLLLLLVISTNVTAANSSIPGMPGPVSGQVNVCPFVGTGAVAVYSIDPVEGAELYLWTVPPAATLLSGQGSTSISVTFAAGFTASANKQIRVRAISHDGNSADRILYLVSQQPSTPNAISGPSNACIFIGTSNQATYSIAKDPAATGYIWAMDAEGTQVLHPNGQGVNDTVIKVIFKSQYKTTPISVQSVNSCGFSAMRILTVSGAAPSQPGLISGPTNACAYMLPNGVAATYSINPVAGASAYTWITPANSVVTHPNGSGVNDISINVQYPADFTGGSISVIASSGCDDSSPRSLSIIKLNPGTPGLITPVQQSFCPDREYLYKLPSMPSNSTAVNWTVPVDALSVTGQGTATIVVAYPGTHIVGMVTARGVNNCASSSLRQSAVDILRCQVERPGGNPVGKGAGPVTGQLQNKIPTGADQDEPAVGSEDLKVNIAPNPARSSFNLKVTSASKESITMKLLDLQGREIKKMNVVKGQSISFGGDLKPGTYILEISQGTAKDTRKLLKL